MKGAKPTIIVGIIVMILGNVFNFQGQSVIGPETSFMYSNPDWITYGIQIVIIGGVIFGAGVAMAMIKRN
ncbi:hypothetical protein [Nitrosopumilus sp.]|uniref:hypothetical protein n=1 Tax=Nitrosopumilus sp. TaxID=2024843 RepID=UPI002636FE7E|nr:hypothetical protein [Nitrosopumilus sp.]